MITKGINLVPTTKGRLSERRLALFLAHLITIVVRAPGPIIKLELMSTIVTTIILSFLDMVKGATDLDSRLFAY